MFDLLNIALPADLRDLIAAAAVARNMHQSVLADTLLTEQLSAAIAAHERGESLAALSHPRLMANSQRATLNIYRSTNDRALELSAAISASAAYPITKSLLIRALLWEAIEPVQASERIAPLPPPPPRAFVTMRIPTKLNTALRDCRIGRSITREVLISELLDLSLAELATESPTVRAALAYWPMLPNTNSTSTIQLPRGYDAAVEALADQMFGGVKAQAIQALLGYGLYISQRSGTSA